MLPCEDPLTFLVLFFFFLPLLLPYLDSPAECPNLTLRSGLEDGSGGRYSKKPLRHRAGHRPGHCRSDHLVLDVCSPELSVYPQEVQPLISQFCCHSSPPQRAKPHRWKGFLGEAAQTRRRDPRAHVRGVLVED